MKQISLCELAFDLFFLSFPSSLFGSKFFSDREFVTSSANSSNFGFSLFESVGCSYFYQGGDD